MAGLELLTVGQPCPAAHRPGGAGSQGRRLEEVKLVEEMEHLFPMDELTMHGDHSDVCPTSYWTPARGWPTPTGSQRTPTPSGNVVLCFQERGELGCPRETGVGVTGG